MSPTSRLLLTTGDPFGIGPEIALKAVSELGSSAPVVVGDWCALEGPAEAYGLTLRAAEPGAGTSGGSGQSVDHG